MRALQIPPALAAALSHSSPSLPAQHLAVVSQNLKVVELLADNLVARADAAAAQARAARMAARAAVGARAAAEANAETTADETEAALDVRDLSLKAWVDAALPDGRTPLHLACSAGHPAMVAALLQRGADPATQATRSGGTCLQTAITAAAPDNSIEFMHGYTYSAHPLACAAGMAMLTHLTEGGLYAQGAALVPHFQDALHSTFDDDK